MAIRLRELSKKSHCIHFTIFFLHLIDVGDLKYIIKALKQSYFPSHRWSPLGLQLGLLQPTLSSIRTKYRDDPESCLHESLTQWLSKADKVTESGGPTWDSLTDALKTIE